MRVLTSNESTSVSGGDLIANIIIGSGIIGAVCGGLVGATLAQHATKYTNAWVQYHAIENGALLGAITGGGSGLFLATLPLVAGGFTTALGIGFFVPLMIAGSIHYDNF